VVLAAFVAYRFLPATAHDHVDEVDLIDLAPVAGS
jgi:hypothetical protein